MFIQHEITACQLLFKSLELCICHRLALCHCVLLEIKGKTAEMGNLSKIALLRLPLSAPSCCRISLSIQSYGHLDRTPGATDQSGCCHWNGKQRASDAGTIGNAFGGESHAGKLYRSQRPESGRGTPHVEQACERTDPGR